MTGFTWRTPLIKKAAAMSFFVFFCLIAGVSVKAQISEGFDTVNSNNPIPVPNWAAINNSSPIGPSMWFQGNPGVFTSQTGADDSYIGANFQNTGDVGTISDWLLTPQVTLHNGDVLRFWTRTVEKSPYPDRLEVRLSTSGASTDVGTTPTSVGVFTTVLLQINPNLEVGGYPETWTLEEVTLSGLSGTPSGRIALRYYVTNGGTNGDNSDYIGVDTFSFGSATVPHAHQESDYNGDGKTDFSTVRNIGGGASGQTQFITRLNGGSPATDRYFSWGIASDTFLPNDYDGDGKTDYAVWRPSDQHFYIFDSSTGTFEGTNNQFGDAADDPNVVADYDGDGKTDVATTGSRAGVPLCTSPRRCFFYRGTLNNPNRDITYIPWGLTTDFPAPGDYNADGKADFAVQRNAGDGFARFYIGYGPFPSAVDDTFEWGTPTDTIAPGDYDGDGKTDIATIRSNGTNLLWYVRNSSAPQTYNYYAPTLTFGVTASDFAVQGDYDGDGKTDIAIWRPSVFWYAGSTSGVTGYPWGADGDYPGANWNTH
jgi:FG-GAP-like repeat